MTRSIRPSETAGVRESVRRFRGRAETSPAAVAEARIATLGEGDLLPPVHPGEILMEEFLRPLGIGTTVAARRMNLPRTRVERVVRGEVGVTADTAMRLEAFLGAPARVWLNLQDRYELDLVRAKKDTSIDSIRPWAEAGNRDRTGEP